MSKVVSQTSRLSKTVIPGKTPRIIAVVMLMLIASGVSLCISSVISAQSYKKTNLVSNISGRAHYTDSNLINPWGIAHSPTGPWVVANNHSGFATVYKGNGAPSSGGNGAPFSSGTPLIINIQSASGDNGPVTGVVLNENRTAAVSKKKSAEFIFVTEDGSISVWNRDVDATNAILKANNPNAIYKGVTMATNGYYTNNYLYTANFHEGSVDVFDATFNKVALGQDAFVDKRIPGGYGPFNVQNIGGSIYVAFAKQDANKEDEVQGPGFGYVDKFDLSGKLLMRLKHKKILNAPWAIVLTPPDFGEFSNLLLVGNFGNGRIAAYDPATGDYKGLLRNGSGKPILIQGLWGLEFGNGSTAGSATTLYFAAGIHNEDDGLFGTITPIGTITTSSKASVGK